MVMRLECGDTPMTSKHFSPGDREEGEIIPAKLPSMHFAVVGGPAPKGGSDIGRMEVFRVTQGVHPK